ncbi:MAG: hypothetical protein Tsb0021_09240 [Chlamydiales bacterium]
MSHLPLNHPLVKEKLTLFRALGEAPKFDDEEERIKFLSQPQFLPHKIKVLKKEEVQGNEIYLFKFFGENNLDYLGVGVKQNNEGLSTQAHTNQKILDIVLRHRGSFEEQIQLQSLFLKWTKEYGYIDTLCSFKEGSPLIHRAHNTLCKIEKSPLTVVFDSTIRLNRDVVYLNTTERKKLAIVEPGIDVDDKSFNLINNYVDTLNANNGSMYRAYDHLSINSILNPQLAERPYPYIEPSQNYPEKDLIVSTKTGVVLDRANYNKSFIMVTHKENLQRDIRKKTITSGEKVGLLAALVLSSNDRSVDYHVKEIDFNNQPKIPSGIRAGDFYREELDENGNKTGHWYRWNQANQELEKLFLEPEHTLSPAKINQIAKSTVINTKHTRTVTTETSESVENDNGKFTNRNSTTETIKSQQQVIHNSLGTKANKDEKHSFEEENETVAENKDGTRVVKKNVYRINDENATDIQEGNENQIEENPQVLKVETPSLSTALAQPIDGLIKSASEVQGSLEHYQVDLQKKLDRQKNFLLALRVMDAVFRGFSVWQEGRTQERLREYETEARLSAIDAKESSRETNQKWRNLLSDQIMINSWAYEKAKTTLEELDKNLSSLRSQQEELKECENKLKANYSENLAKQKKILEEKLADKKSKLNKWLAAASSLTGLIGGIATPFMPLVGGSLAAAAAGLSAVSSALNDHQAKKEIDANKEEAEIQTQLNKDQQSLEYISGHMDQLHRQQFQMLDTLASSSTVPPWVARAALREKIIMIEEALAKEPPNEDEESAEYIVWKQSQKCLQEIKKEAEKKLQREENLKNIKDRGFRVSENMKNFWRSSDEETNAFADAVNQTIAMYQDSTTPERQTILATLEAFEALAKASDTPWLADASQIGRDGYVIIDGIRYAWTTALPNLKDAITGPGPLVENLGGMLPILANYLVPGIKFVVAAYHIRNQFNNSTKELSRESYMLQELRQLKFSISRLSERIDKQSSAILKEVFECETLISGVEASLRKEMKEEFRNAREKEIQDCYDQETKRLKDHALKIDEKIEKYQRLTKTPENIQSLLAFLIAKSKYMSLDVNNGMNFSANEKTFTSPDITKKIHLNPDYYTAAIASTITGKQTELPSLEIYLRLLNGYLKVIEWKKEIQSSVTLEKNLDTLNNFLKKYGDQLLEFYDHHQEYLEETLNFKNEILKLLKENHMSSRERLLSHRKELIANSIKMVTEKKQPLSGSGRYSLQKILSKKLDNASLPSNHELLSKAIDVLPSQAEEVFKTASVTALKWGAFGGIAAALLAVPIGPAVLFAGGVLGVSNGYLKTKTPSPVSSVRDLLKDPIKVKHLLDFNRRRPIYTESSRDPQGNKRTIELFSDVLTIDICAKRSLNELVAKSAKLKIENGGTYEIYKNSNYTQRPSIIHLRIYKDGPNTLTSSVEIDKHFPLEEKKRIPIEFEGRLKGGDFKRYLDYVQGIEKTSPVKLAEGEKVEVVCSKQQGLIPLVLPESVFEPLKHLVEQLAYSGCHVVPLYQLEQKEQSYDLVLYFEVYDSNNQNVSTAGRMALASFHDTMVNSFGSFEFSDNQITQTKPNVNEFLLHLMYGSSFDLGLPGHKTVLLRNNTLVVPVDHKVKHDVFTLLKTPYKAVFDVREFSQETTDKDLCGEERSVEWFSVDFPHSQKLNGLLINYKERYFGVKAMTSSLYEINGKNSVDSLLHLTGLDLTLSEKVNDLYEFGANKNIANNTPKNPDLKSLLSTYEWRENYQALLAGISILKV